METEFEERLCEEVRYPHLYNTSLKQYKDIQTCNNSWREVAQSLGKEESACRHKWKYLRDRFVTAKKKLKRRSGAPGGRAVPSIVYLLSWLSDFVKHRDTDSNFPVELEGNSFTLNLEATEADESISPRTSTPSPQPEAFSPPPAAAVLSSPTPSSSSASEVFPLPTSLKQKRHTPTTPFEDAILQRLQQIDKAKEDEDHAFSVMVTSMLAKLPPHVRMEAKFEIHQLLYHKQKQAFQNDISQ
ncbi:transcription factor Adf-1-like [Sinocyclocheilus anshuiensis]|uniref:transcription factor Adf-1-like n=1 Tax=Sinocyclocheilus anshuiensis TaxID=1608454 RepID=UPI0007B7CBCC|nr:PREDICTED: transcription factor Adf-1-like [Sinocyclocheilus anshuiensis]